MPRRGGKEASESSSGIGEDERQLVMARLAARWRRSNLVKLVALKRETIRVKHKWEGTEEKIYRRERDSLDGPMKK